MYNAIQDFPGLFVAAAGNEASDNNIYRTIPAGYGSDIMVSGEAIVDREIVLSGSVLIPALQNVIAVAATDSNDQLSSFSNYGTGSVHIAAPGENIYSTFFEENYVSGEAVAISYANGWVKKVGAAPETWAKRSNIVISGSTVDLSGALWGDTRNPYVSGESSYIQKSIPNDAKNIADISLTAWCDTPAYYDSNDRIDILISTGGLFTKFDSIDASSLHYYSDN